jgi:hypothetical protein
VEKVRGLRAREHGFKEKGSVGEYKPPGKKPLGGFKTTGTFYIIHSYLGRSIIQYLV